MTKGVQDRMNAVAALCDDFHRAVFVDADPRAALALVTSRVTLANLPVGGAAEGSEDVGRYLREVLTAYLPADLEFRRISRTGDRWRVVDETTVSFTHDRELPWLLPGAQPTGRRAQVLAITVVTVQGAAIESHRTLWDHHSLVTQLGLRHART